MKALFIFLAPFFCFSQVPAYYNSIDFSQSGDDLKAQLANLITNTHTNLLPYTSNMTDTWDVLVQADINQEDKVLLIYGFNDDDDETKNDRVRDKTLSCHSSSCIGLWNREHVYAKSKATPTLITDSPSAGTDAHNLRTCDSQMNSSRNNRLFENGSGNSHITSNGNWYAGDEWKGDIARIIMYMYVRYPNQCQAINIGTGSTMYSNYDDMYDLFLDWNVEDPISALELQRNNTLESIQGNRNPFIDNPYLATIIWNGNFAEDTWNVLNKDEYTQFNIKIHPTITSDFIQITTKSPIISIDIIDMNAKKIRVRLENDIIDVRNLAKGIYLVKISTTSSISNYRFLKN